MSMKRNSLYFLAIAFGMCLPLFTACDNPNQSDNISSQNQTFQKAPDSPNPAENQSISESTELAALAGIQFQSGADGTIKSIDFSGCTGDWTSKLALLGQLPKLEAVTVAGELVTDDVMASLGKLTSLKSLRIKDSRVTDQGLAAISGMTKLRSRP